MSMQVVVMDGVDLQETQDYTLFYSSWKQQHEADYKNKNSFFLRAGKVDINNNHHITNYYLHRNSFVCQLNGGHSQ